MAYCISNLKSLICILHFIDSISSVAFHVPVIVKEKVSQKHGLKVRNPLFLMQNFFILGHPIGRHNMVGLVSEALLCDEDIHIFINGLTNNIIINNHNSNNNNLISFRKKFIRQV